MPKTVGGEQKVVRHPIVLDAVICCLCISIGFLWSTLRQRFISKWSTALITPALFPIWLISRVVIEPVVSLCGTFTHTILFIVFRPWLAVTVVCVVITYHKHPPFRRFCWKFAVACFIWALSSFWRLLKYLFSRLG